MPAAALLAHSTARSMFSCVGYMTMLCAWFSVGARAPIIMDAAPPHDIAVSASNVQADLAWTSKQHKPVSAYHMHPTRT